MGKLGSFYKRTVKEKVKRKIEKPSGFADKLRGMPNCYKIKLRSVGYRLIYKVIEDRVVIQVIVVAKRDKNFVYDLAQRRLL